MKYFTGNWNAPIIYYWIKGEYTMFKQILYATAFELQAELKKAQINKKLS